MAKYQLIIFCGGTPLPGEFIMGSLIREKIRIYPSAAPFSFSQAPFDSPAQTFDIKKNGVIFLRVQPAGDPFEVPPCFATNVWNTDDFPEYVEFDGENDIITAEFTGASEDSQGRDMSITLAGLREEDWP